MSYNLDIRANDALGNPSLFWANRGDPFVIASQAVAQSGNIAIVRTQKNNLVGCPMVVRFVLARASHIMDWQDMAQDDPFNTTVLANGFSTGHTVIFQLKNPIQYQNMVLRDGNYDLAQSFFDSGSGDYRPGFDLWMGVLNLIIAS